MKGTRSTTDLAELATEPPPSRWHLISGPAGSLNPQREMTKTILNAIAKQAADSTSDAALCFDARSIDCVFSGGGMRGYYCTGAYEVLRRLEDRGDFRIRRWVSSTCISRFMLCVHRGLRAGMPAHQQARGAQCSCAAAWTPWTG